MTRLDVQSGHGKRGVRSWDTRASRALCDQCGVLIEKMRLGSRGSLGEVGPCQCPEFGGRRPALLWDSWDGKVVSPGCACVKVAQETEDHKCGGVFSLCVLLWRFHHFPFECKQYMIILYVR